jgi:hypothetical protein
MEVMPPRLILPSQWWVRSVAFRPVRRGLWPEYASEHWLLSLGSSLFQMSQEASNESPGSIELYFRDLRMIRATRSAIKQLPFSFAARR